MYFVDFTSVFILFHQFYVPFWPCTFMASAGSLSFFFSLFLILLVAFEHVQLRLPYGLWLSVFSVVFFFYFCARALLCYCFFISHFIFTQHQNRRLLLSLIFILAVIYIKKNSRKTVTENILGEGKKVGINCMPPHAFTVFYFIFIISYGIVQTLLHMSLIVFR